MQDLLGFDITTRKREIKPIYPPPPIVYLTDIRGTSIKYKEIPFSQLFPYVFLCFMIRDLTCIESNDKKIPLVLAVGVLQGNHLVQFF